MGAYTSITGSCHCGNLRFVFERAHDGRQIAVRECGCTFCRKHGGVWTSDPQGSLRVSVADASRLSRYRFGTGTAEFCVCAECGVVPLVVSEIDGSTYAVVSARAFDDSASLEMQQATSDFSGEAVGDRLERRKKTWIANVSFDEAPA